MNENFSTRFGRVDIFRVKKAAPGVAAMDVVMLDGLDIGLITRFRNTRTDKFPWTAFLGVGEGQTLIGHFYESKHAAVLAILDAHTTKL